MKYFDVKAKDKKVYRTVDLMEFLSTMDELERFNGATKEKIVENYYNLKQQIREILVEIKKDDTKKKSK